MWQDADVGKCDGVFGGQALIIDFYQVFHRCRRLVEANGEILFIQFVVGPDFVFRNGFFFYLRAKFGIALEYGQILAFGERGVGFGGLSTGGMTGRQGDRRWEDKARQDCGKGWSKHTRPTGQI